MNLNDQCPRPDAIIEHHRRSREALSVLWTALQTGIPLESRFAGMTDLEFELARTEIYEELDLQTILLLAASFEAVFQVELHTRVNEKWKDAASRNLRKLWQRRRRIGRLEVEDILEFWKRETGRRHEIGELKQLIQYRHWLAHGRYWVQHSGLTDIEPVDAWERGRAVFEVLPGFPKLSSY